MDKKQCDRCLIEATGCAQCGTIPASYAFINSKPIWKASHKGRCWECALEKAVDINEVCRSCNQDNHEMKLREVVLCKACVSEYALVCKKCKEDTDVYAEGSNYCPTCFYGDDFKTVTIDSRHPTEVCVSCGELSHLNKDKECKNCYVEKTMSNAYNDDWGKTKVCPECRKITKRGNKICTACQLKKRSVATCFGCSSRFQKTSRHDTFCQACKRNLEVGICTSCRRNDVENFDERGWCTKCQYDNGPL